MRSFDVAVVIVTYRTAELTIACLRSVQEERQASKEITVRAVVVDNASGDAAVIRSALEAEGWQSWVTLIEAPMNGGFAYGNNLGAQHAYAEKIPDYVYVLNPDTEVRPSAIGSLVRFLEASPRVGIAGGSFEHLDGRIWPIAFRFPTIFSELSHGLQVDRLPLVAAVDRGVAHDPTNATHGLDLRRGHDDPPCVRRRVRRELLSLLRRNGFLQPGQTSRICHLVRPRKPRHAHYGTEHQSNRRESRFTKVSCVLVSVSKTVLCGDLWSAPRDGHRLNRGIANSLGLMKRLALRRPSVPYYIRDLISHSVLWPRNGSVPAVRCFRPGG